MYPDFLTPTLRDLQNIVIPRVAHRWHELGIQLLDPSQEKDLDKIQLAYSNDFQQGCVEMVKYWLTNTSDATWDSLIYALKTPGLGLLAIVDDVEVKIKG